MSTTVVTVQDVESIIRRRYDDRLPAKRGSTELSGFGEAVQKAIVAYRGAIGRGMSGVECMNEADAAFFKAESEAWWAVKLAEGK